MVLYSLRLTPELKAGLERLKERDGIPESEAIRRATTEFLAARGIEIGVAKGEKRPKKRAK